MNLRLLLCTALFSITGAANAQTIFRCGNEYTRVPCSDGRAVDAQGSASAQQRLEAERVYARQKQLGDDMARDRQQREAALKPSKAASLSPRPAATAASASLKPKARARGRMRVVSGDDFVASVPRTKTDRTVKKP